MLQLELPYPPALNSLYRSSGKRWYISKKATDYKESVHLLVRPLLTPDAPYFIVEQLSVSITCAYPDKRRRDIDGILKVLLDSMTYAGVYTDDSQIKRLEIEVFPHVIKGGKLWVTIRPMDVKV